MSQRKRGRYKRKKPPKAGRNRGEAVRWVPPVRPGQAGRWEPQVTLSQPRLYHSEAEVLDELRRQWREQGEK